MENPNRIIVAEGLCFEYQSAQDTEEKHRRLKALSDLSLSIIEGKFVVIAGRNGSGKSTFARAVGALLEPNDGILTVAGLDARDPKNMWPIRQQVGSIFQNPDNQLVASIVEEDVAFGPQNMNLPVEEIQKRVDDALEATALWDVKLQSPHRLSGGQKQRVAIAGVLAMKSHLIVLDEPTAMLDPQGRKEVLKTLHKLNKENNITILHITHHMDEATDADYIYVMDEGKIALQGTPKEVFSQSRKLKQLGLKLPPSCILGEALLGQTAVLSMEELEEMLCHSN